MKSQFVRRVASAKARSQEAILFFDVGSNPGGGPAVQSFCSPTCSSRTTTKPHAGRQGDSKGERREGRGEELGTKVDFVQQVVWQTDHLGIWLK